MQHLDKEPACHELIRCKAKRCACVSVGGLEINSIGMRVTVREALPACLQVHRGGSGGLNQTVCPSQPDTFFFLERKPNLSMYIYTWCQEGCVCVFSLSLVTVCVAENAVIYVWFFFSCKFQCDGMNWPLQVSADCLVLHVHLQHACIHSVPGSYLRSTYIPSQQQNSMNSSTHMVPDVDDQTPSVDFQKQHKSKQLWSSSRIRL